jgi:hypothetical protein
MNSNNLSGLHFVILIKNPIDPTVTEVGLALIHTTILVWKHSIDVFIVRLKSM